MLKVYLLSFNDTQITRDELTALLDQNDTIVNWSAPLPALIFLVSEKSASELQRYILEKRPKEFQYLLSKVDTDKNGWLPKNTWSFINDPKPA